MAGRSCLYLHVGTHKTGTTSIQSFIAGQAADLRASGIEPWSGPRSANMFHLAHAFLRPRLATPMRLTGRHDLTGLSADNPALSAFCRAVPRIGARAHLVSSESFCFARTDRERAFLIRHLGGLFDEIRPIVAFRARADWERSWRQQVAKAGVAGAIEALPETRRVTAEWYFDRDAILSFWGGVGPVTVIDYDAAVQEDGSILPAFLRAIDQPGIGIAQQYFENVSPAMADGHLRPGSN